MELTDDVRARLVVVRSARALQHAPDLTSGVRAQRVVIESPAVSRSAAAAARRLFGRRPLWAPPGPDGRRLLTTRSRPLPTRPTLHHRASTCPARSTPRSGGWTAAARAPTGRSSAGTAAAAGPSGGGCATELPDTGRLDVRLLDGAGSAAGAFGRFGAAAQLAGLRPGRGEPALVPLPGRLLPAPARGRHARRPRPGRAGRARRRLRGRAARTGTRPPSATRPSTATRTSCPRRWPGCTATGGRCARRAPAAPRSCTATTATSCTPSGWPGWQPSG